MGRGKGLGCECEMRLTSETLSASGCLLGAPGSEFVFSQSLITPRGGPIPQALSLSGHLPCQAHLPPLHASNGLLSGENQEGWLCF